MAAHVPHDEDVRGVRDPDFLALGLGGTSMLAMLWAVAMGRRAVGIEMRGDPFLGVHWNVRADLYHQLGLIDRLMIERYGEDRIPRRGERKQTISTGGDVLQQRDHRPATLSPTRSSTVSTPIGISPVPFITSSS